MQVLVLGGTGWLGREIGRQAVAGGHDVTCLARGRAGPVAEGARLVTADRSSIGAYDALTGQDWDVVVEVSWQPGMVRSALQMLESRARLWAYISSSNVYASHASPGADESAAVLPATSDQRVDPAQYGEAKVACEQMSAEALDDRLLVARAGLIGGPGDDSDRSGAWVARAARDTEGAMLMPDAPDLATQVIDVRDLAAWLLRCGQQGITGTFNAVGPRVPFGDWVAASRAVGGHTGREVLAPGGWLLEQGVKEYMGEESLALWLVDPAYAGWSSRSGAAAEAAGLRHRSRESLLRDVLAWERQQGLERPRKAGLSPGLERRLLAALSSSPR